MDRCASLPYGLLYVVSLWTVVHRFLMDCCKPLIRFLMDYYKLFPYGPFLTWFSYGLLCVVCLWSVVRRFFIDSYTSFTYVSCFLMDCCKPYPYGLL